MKKFISLILALVLIASTFAVAAAAADNVNPVIVVSGMNAYPLYDENGKSMYPMEADVIFKNVPPIAGGAAASLLSMNWKYFGKYAIDPIANLFEGIACDETGSSVKNIHTDTFTESLDHYRDEFSDQKTNQQGAARAIADKIGWENVYFMHYDWRISPVKLADELKEYIERAMAEHGGRKVSLVPMSFGGTIVNAYLMKYGSDNIKSITYASTAFNGVELVGKLFAGDPQITLCDVMVFMAGFAGDVAFVNEVLSFIAANELKRNTIAERIVDKTVVSFIDELKDDAYDRVFGSSFARMKGLWTLMPNEYYESAKAFMKQHTTYSTDFFNEIDEYMNFQAQLKPTFESLQEKGVNVYITGAYVTSGIPVSSGADKWTDTLIETYLMTGDATVAPYGRTLTDIGYTPVDNTHLSTDGIIDASTCMLPEQTWFVKGIGHLKYTLGTRGMDLIVWLATSDDSLSVTSSDLFPQFFEVNNKTGSFKSLTDGNNGSTDGKTHWYDFIVKAFSRFMNILKTIFKLNPTV